MTAPVPSTDLREQLARAMFDADDWHPDDWDKPNGEWTAEYRRRADVTLAVVAAHLGQQQAQALTEAADDLGTHDQDIEVALGGAAYVRLWLRDRAAALGTDR